MNTAILAILLAAAPMADVDAGGIDMHIGVGADRFQSELPVSRDVRHDDPGFRIAPGQLSHVAGLALILFATADD